MATHSSVLAWRIPGTGSLVGCRLWGRTESETTEATQQQQQKDGTDEPICRAAVETQRKQSYGDSWRCGEAGEGGMQEESNQMETYITMCKIASHWQFAIRLRELKPGLCNNLEG